MLVSGPYRSSRTDIRMCITDGWIKKCIKCCFSGISAKGQPSKNFKTLQSNLSH